MIETCDECRFYDGMNGKCVVCDNEDELCPVAKGEAEPEKNYECNRD